MLSDECSTALGEKVKASRLLTHTVADYATKTQSPEALKLIAHLAHCMRQLARVVAYCHTHPQVPMMPVVLGYLLCLTQAALLNQDIPKKRDTATARTTRSKLLDAVVAVIHEGRVHELNSSELVRLTSSTSTTIFAYFGNLPNLLVAAYGHMLNDSRR